MFFLFFLPDVLVMQSFSIAKNKNKSPRRINTIREEREDALRLESDYLNSL
jgi:hypothetical protein